MKKHSQYVLSSGVILLLLVTLAIVGWEYETFKIRVDEHAPQLQLLHKQAIDFSFMTLDGDVRRLSDFKGKTVFVNLWGTWCIQCVAEMPTIQALYDHYQQRPDVVFLIISRLDSPARIRIYARSNKYTLPFYTMSDSDIPKTMQFNQFPATFIYSPSGVLVAEHIGAADWSAPSARQFIDSLAAAR